MIRRGTFTSVTDLIAANESYIGPWNDRCERFTWTNHSGLILAKAVHPKKRTHLAGRLYAAMESKSTAAALRWHETNDWFRQSPHGPGPVHLG